MEQSATPRWKQNQLIHSLLGQPTYSGLLYKFKKRKRKNKKKKNPKKLVITAITITLAQKEKFETYLTNYNKINRTHS